MKKKLCGVYCIENKINQKKYIGMSRDIKRRWAEHKTELNSHKHINSYLQSAWDKYGKENFVFYIVELCSEKSLSMRECFYIQFYKTMSHECGYNLTIGGEDTSIGKPVVCLRSGVVYNFVDEAAKDANICVVTMISWCRQKRNYMYLSEYSNLSEAEKRYWKDYDWDKAIHDKLSQVHSRKNLSRTTINKIVQNTSGDKNPRALKVYCPQLDEYFNCIKYASDKYGINQGSISACVKGKLKSAGKHPVTKEKLTWKLIEK